MLGTVHALDFVDTQEKPSTSSEESSSEEESEKTSSEEESEESGGEEKEDEAVKVTLSVQKVAHKRFQKMPSGTFTSKLKQTFVVL